MVRSPNRRQVLVEFGSTLGAATLAGCVSFGRNSPNPQLTSLQGWPPEDGNKELEFWSWQNHWGNQAIAFRHAGDLESIDRETVPGAEQARRLDDGESVDVVHITPRHFDRARTKGLLQPIPVKQLPAWPESRELNALNHAHDVTFYQDEEEFYGAPQTPMYHGLAYHSRRITDEPDSWSLLWDDAYEGELAMPADPVLACQTAALYTGQNPNNPDDVADIAAALEQQQPLLDSYWTDWLDCWRQFGDGELVGAVLPKPRFCLCSEDETPVKRTAPSEGVMYGYSTLAVPKTATNPWRGLEFVNWGLGFKTGTNTLWHPDEWTLYHDRALEDRVRSKYVEIAADLGIGPEA